MQAYHILKRLRMIAYIQINLLDSNTGGVPIHYTDAENLEELYSVEPISTDDVHSCTYMGNDALDLSVRLLDDMPACTLMQQLQVFLFSTDTDRIVRICTHS